MASAEELKKKITVCMSTSTAGMHAAFIDRRRRPFWYWTEPAGHHREINDGIGRCHALSARQKWRSLMTLAAGGAAAEENCTKENDNGNQTQRLRGVAHGPG
jgi:hypothetical protein